MSEGPEVIVITGASSGIGRELALQLARDGREIWLVGRNPQRLDEVAEKVRAAGAMAHPVRLDLADIDSCGTWLRENLPEEKEVNSVYLSAAVSAFGEVRDMLPEDWETLYATNLLSPVQWTRHFYGGMTRRRRGRIVLISSLAAYSGYPTATAYATMKAGLLGMHRSLVHEGAAHGVRIHLASPGYVRTGIYRAAIFRGTTYGLVIEQIRALGFEMMEADEAARILLKLVERGRSEFAYPFYGSALRSISLRVPAILRIIHRGMMDRFRASSLSS